MLAILAQVVVAQDMPEKAGCSRDVWRSKKKASNRQVSFELFFINSPSRTASWRMNQFT